MGLIFDTSIFVRAERKGLADVAVGESPDVRSGVSVITVSELLVGVHRAANATFRDKRSKLVEELLAGVEVFPMTLEIARLHARLAAGLAARGQMIGAHDLIIAATALHLGWPVKTTNEREFRRVEGLHVIAA